jgi:hypothetical protein
LGLSIDYEVFLLLRVKEGYDRTGDDTASVALGLERHELSGAAGTVRRAANGDRVRR